MLSGEKKKNMTQEICKIIYFANRKVLSSVNEFNVRRKEEE